MMIYNRTFLMACFLQKQRQMVVLWFFSGGSADILFPLLFQSKLEFLPNVTSTYTVLAYGKKIFHKYVEFSNSNIQGHTGSICSFPITLVDEPLLCLVKAVEGRFCFKKRFPTQPQRLCLPSRIDSKASATLLPQAHFRYRVVERVGEDKIGMENRICILQRQNVLLSNLLHMKNDAAFTHSLSARP